MSIRPKLRIKKAFFIITLFDVSIGNISLCLEKFNPDIKIQAFLLI
ncbi:hypothetical protein TREAZ_2189 [Leadbettera azotonutricia ZAS-9]|uniref:Uncharacterized protein n=1 Tax=Leadbettera azotonutricia (strain ATCC BAA-888 / DSM 13862 / ZAS-9) TaxID=545695 RepID=F5Y8R6_LEAAZ|nr:hypothetical protein TREAZ_2189 [Leadbettera azotonutricia ZAS-9]